MSNSNHILNLAQKLEGVESWPAFKVQITAAARAREVYGYLTGTITIPTASATTQSNDPNAPATPQEWQRYNDAAIAMVLLNVSPGLAVPMGSMTKASEAWAYLTAEYEWVSWAGKALVEKSLRALKYNDADDMDAHILEFRLRSAKCTSLGIVIANEMMALILVESLPSSWDHIVSNLTNGAKLNEIVAKIRLEASRRGTATSPTDQALYSSTVRTSRVQSGLTCNNCGRTGHMKETCFRKGGGQEGKYPDWWKGSRNGTGTAPVERANLAIRGPDRSSSAYETHIAFASIDEIGDERDFARKFFIDSGTTSHIINNKKSFTELKEINETQVHGAEHGSTFRAIAKGTVELHTVYRGEHYRIDLRDALYCPGAATNLISVPRLDEGGLNITFGGSQAEMKTKTGKVFAVARKRSLRLYELEFEPRREHVLMAVDRSTWHRRLCHAGEGALNTLIRKGMATGVKLTSRTAPGDCEDCIFAKQSRAPFPDIMTRAANVLDRVHGDLWGPARTTSLGGAMYFLLFTDDHSRKRHQYPLKRKSDALLAFKSWRAMVELETGRKLKVFHYDNGGELLSNEFRALLDEAGIVLETTAPGTPQQNGIAERGNRTVLEHVRAVLYDSGLPGFLWAEAVATVVYVLNRTPTRALENVVPEEAWSGHKPDIAHLRAFGATAYVHVQDHKRGKLDPKSTMCIMVGYYGDAAYRCYDPLTRKVLKSHDVIFEEGMGHRTLEAHDDPLATLADNPPTRETPNPDLAPAPAPPPAPPPAPAPPAPALTVDQPVPRRSGRTVPRTYGDDNAIGREIDLAQKEGREPVFSEQAHLSYGAAMASPRAREYEAAMQKEMDTLNGLKAWDLVDLPEGKVALPSLWVCNPKDSGGVKGRVVVQGSKQRPGIDYDVDAVYSGVVVWGSARRILAEATQEGKQIVITDFKSAYLNAPIKGEIYMRQPRGHEVAGEENKVCLLRRNLYGTHEAGRTWNNMANDVLSTIGLIATSADGCAYHRHDKGGRTLSCIHVDDMLSVVDGPREAERLVKELGSRFEVRDETASMRYLGVQIEHDQKSGTVKISQPKYIDEMLERLGFANIGTASTPMATGLVLSKEDCPTSDAEIRRMGKLGYATIVGGVMWAANATRPDIAHAAQALSQFMQNPGEKHYQAAKHLLRYLKATRTMGITYRRSAALLPDGYSDSDWASDVDTRRSTSGYVFRMAGGAVSWSSKKQPTVALSSTESEYMASTHSVKEAVWLTKLLRETGHVDLGTMTIYGDNQGALALARNPVFHSRTKHIDIQHHFVREQVEAGSVHLEYVPTGDNLADILTKSLARPAFEKLRGLLGV